jgi:uncharacterized protein involved in exopolysaccharide biosynthesis
VDLRDKVRHDARGGIVGDSIGRRAGFAWAPNKALLGERTIKFRVRQPREVSNDILGRLQVYLAEGANLIVMRLSGKVQQRPAETLNAWGEQFVRIATDLKAAKVTASSKVLAEQRADAERRLSSAERAYEQFRVSTITQPSEAMAIAPGAAMGGVPMVRTDPAVENYTTSKYQLEALRRDRSQLEGVARTLRPDYVPTAALLNVPVVNVDPAASELRASVAEMVSLESQVRVLRQTYQDITPPLSTKLGQLRTLQSQTIPQQLAAFVGQLRQREGQLGGVVTRSTGELRAIPQRTTQQEALRRDRDAAAELFRVLDTRFKEVELSQKSLTPDVRVLDAAVMPSEPNENTAPRLIALGLAVGLAIGAGLAVILDRIDRRFRYPTQATHGLGLQILGAVPRIDQRRQSPERVAQIVEAFRAVRMNVRYACMPNPRVTLTVTSPSPHDGKSLVASNLALSFAEGGWRTVIVDGDLRRGQLNSTFDLPSGPGSSSTSRARACSARWCRRRRTRTCRSWPRARATAAAPSCWRRRACGSWSRRSRGVRRGHRRLAAAQRRHRRLRPRHGDGERGARAAARRHRHEDGGGQAADLRPAAGAGHRRGAQRGRRRGRHVPVLRLRPRLPPRRGRLGGRRRRVGRAPAAGGALNRRRRAPRLGRRSRAGAAGAAARRERGAALTSGPPLCVGEGRQPCSVQRVAPVARLRHSCWTGAASGPGPDGGRSQQKRYRTATCTSRSGPVLQLRRQSAEHFLLNRCPCCSTIRPTFRRCGGR